MFYSLSVGVVVRTVFVRAMDPVVTVFGILPTIRTLDGHEVFVLLFLIVTIIKTLVVVIHIFSPYLYLLKHNTHCRCYLCTHTVFIDTGRH